MKSFCCLPNLQKGKKEELGNIFCPVLLNGKVRTYFHEMNEWQIFEIIPQANENFTLVILLLLILRLASKEK